MKKDSGKREIHHKYYTIKSFIRTFSKKYDLTWFNLVFLKWI